MGSIRGLLVFCQPNPVALVTLGSSNQRAGIDVQFGSSERRRKWRC